MHVYIYVFTCIYIEDTHIIAHLYLSNVLTLTILSLLTFLLYDCVPNLEINHNKGYFW